MAFPDPTHINTTPPTKEQGDQARNRWLIENFRIIRAIVSGGASGSFVAQSGETITVTKGVITGIEAP